MRYALVLWDFDGMDVAAVTWGINSKAILAEHAPTHLIERPGQLLDLLHRTRSALARS